MNKSTKDILNFKVKYYILKLLFFSPIGIIGATYIIYFYKSGLSKLETNILSSIFMLSVVLFEIPTGIFSDTKGKRKTLIFSGLSLSFSMLLFFIFYK